MNNSGSLAKLVKALMINPQPWNEMKIILFSLLLLLMSCLDDATVTVTTDTSGLEVFQCLSGKYAFCDCENTTDSRVENMCMEQDLLLEGG